MRWYIEGLLEWKGDMISLILEKARSGGVKSGLEAKWTQGG